MLSLWQQRQTYSIDPSGLQLALQIYSVEFHLIYTSVIMKVVRSLIPEKARVAGKTAFSQKETLSRTWVKRGNPPAGEQRRRRTEGGEQETLRTNIFRLLWGYLGFQDCAVERAGPSLVQEIKLQRPQRGCNNN